MTALTLNSWSQYYSLTKPKVVYLIVFTAMVGMLLAADGAPPLDTFVFGLLGKRNVRSYASVHNCEVGQI